MYTKTTIKPPTNNKIKIYLNQEPPKKEKIKKERNTLNIIIHNTI